MGVAEVKEYLKTWGKDTAIKEYAASCATVELAAGTVGVEAARIAKTLCFKTKQTNVGAGVLSCLLIVAAGDARIDGKKFKEHFGIKSHMPSPEDVPALTGHAVGGVCPFAVNNPDAGIYLDISLKRFATVYPSCGSANAVLEISCQDLFAIARARDWVDVCTWRQT